MYETKALDGGKARLVYLPDGSTKGNIRDPELAERIKHLLNLDRPGRQLVSLSNETCRKIGELMEYYSDKGVPEINRADIINTCINTIHSKLIVKEDE